MDRNVAGAAAVIAVIAVVPYVGTWIEIKIYKKTALGFNVVPYVGTWIEIEEQEELT